MAFLHDGGGGEMRGRMLLIEYIYHNHDTAIFSSTAILLWKQRKRSKQAISLLCHHIAVFLYNNSNYPVPIASLCVLIFVLFTIHEELSSSGKVLLKYATSCVLGSALE